MKKPITLMQPRIVPSTKKTIEQLINDLPEPYKTQAWENIENERLADPEQMAEDLATVLVNDTPQDAMLNAFSWLASKEGRPYWSNVYNELNEKYKADRLPKKKTRKNGKRANKK